MLEELEEQASAELEPALFDEDEQASTELAPTLLEEDKQVSTELEPALLDKDEQAATGLEPTLLDEDEQASTKLEPTLQNEDEQASTKLEPVLLDEGKRGTADGAYAPPEQVQEQGNDLKTNVLFRQVAHSGKSLLVDELLRQEINCLQNRIKKYYNFTLFDLLGNVPVGREVQEACRCAAVCIAQTHIFLKEVRRTGNLPVKTLSEVLKIPTATLEGNRMYILVLAESHAGTELSELFMPEEQPIEAAGEALVVEVRRRRAAVLIEGGRMKRVNAQGLSVGAWTMVSPLSEKNHHAGAGLVCALGAALVVLCWFLLGRWL